MCGGRAKAFRRMLFTRTAAVVGSHGFRASKVVCQTRGCSSVRREGTVFPAQDHTAKIPFLLFSTISRSHVLSLDNPDLLTLALPRAQRFAVV